MSLNRSIERLPDFIVPWWVVGASLASLAIGVAALVIILAQGPSLDAWLWMNVGFVYFLGVANGMLAWAAVFRVAQTRWTPAINRLGHATLFYIPFLAVMLIILLTGVRHYAPWAWVPVPGKEAWLNVPFMVGRLIVVSGALWTLFFLLVRWSLTADAKADRGDALTQQDHYRLTAIAIASVIMYTITMTIVSWDFIMSLTPEWISTMFGPYYFITNMYVGMAVLILLAALLRERLNVVRYLEAQQFHDMGNLLLGFGLFSMGLFFAQYLTIWYANLPWETGFLITRYLKGPWPPLAWTAFFIGYLIPFFILQSRSLKRNPRLLAPVTLLVIVGVALERYVLVVPSLLPGRLFLMPIPALIILAMLGAFVLSIVLFLKRYQPVSAADAALRESEIEQVEVQL